MNGHKNHRIVKACRRAWTLSDRGRWLVAISGGADSTALLLACRLAGIPIEAAHCNFNLRGPESLRDREFVASFCRRLDIPLYIADFDTLSQQAKGESLEMTCRRLRYDFFRSLSGFSRIAVAHNADDNIETFLLNALRGSGSRGLKAMEPDTGRLARPLLSFSRADIIQFLETVDQPFVVDSTNATSDYRRNFLRNEVLPLLRSRWPGADRALSSSIRLLARDNAIVEHFIAGALRGHAHFLPWETINNFPDPPTLIFHFIRPFGGSPVIADEMADGLKSPRPGKSWRLSDSRSALFTKKGIKIEDYLPVPSAAGFSPQFCSESVAPDSLDFQAVKSSPLSELYIALPPEDLRWLPADKSMKIKSLGLAGSQSVWKVLKDAGLSLAERSRFPVLVHAASGSPVWLPGIKRSSLFLISPESPVITHFYNMIF